jgi:hypothetical protein
MLSFKEIEQHLLAWMLTHMEETWEVTPPTPPTIEDLKLPQPVIKLLEVLQGQVRKSRIPGWSDLQFGVYMHCWWFLGVQDQIPEGQEPITFLERLLKRLIERGVKPQFLKHLLSQAHVDV